MNDRQRKIFKKMIAHKGMWFGGSILIFISFIAIFAPFLAPTDIEDIDIMMRIAPPSSEHLLGCDLDGRDVLTSMLYGARISLYIAMLTVLLQVTVGLLVGLISGYKRGWIDTILMRLVEIVLAVPNLLMAMVLAALLGPSINNIIFAIAATGWASTARLVRGQVLSAREKEYVTASLALGAKDTRLIFKHILPQTITPIIVQSTFSLSGVIIVEAGLSFLGLGAQNEIPTWGAILGQGRTVITEAPHLSLAPGIAIMLIVLSLNFLGDALRDVLDPKAT